MSMTVAGAGEVRAAAGLVSAIGVVEAAWAAAEAALAADSEGPRLGAVPVVAAVLACC